MSFAQVLEELPALSVKQRQILILRALELEDGPLSPEEEALVETRLNAHHKDPLSSVPLNEFKKRMRNRSSK
jgi:putative addiction module component (TIGR02574 family)